MTHKPVHRDELLAVLARLERQRNEFAQTIESLRQTVNDGDPPNFIPLKAAAGRTRYSVETVRQWVVRGIVIGKRVGGRWLVELGSLEAYVRQRTSTAA